MESCLHFHSMIWIFDKDSSLVLSTLYAKLKLLSHISQWNIVIFFIQSYLPVWIHNNNSSLVLSTLDAKLNLLSHISQWNIVFSFIQSYLPVWIFNNNLKVKSMCQIQSFVTYLTMESCLLFHSKLRIHVLFSNPDVKLDLLSHIQQWNFCVLFYSIYSSEWTKILN